MTSFSLVLVLCGPALGQDYVLPAATETPKLDYRADELSYDRNKAELTLRGGVRVTDPTWNLKSDEVRLDLERKKGEARGFVLLETDESAVWGDRGTFDFETHSGELFDASGGYRPWYIQSRKLLIDDGLHVYRTVRFTSCSYVPEPHYHMRASSLKVRPKEWVSATNVVAFLGDVPIFYFPYFYHRLGGGKLFTTTLRLGYSRRNGGELLTTTTLKWTPEFYGRLFLDGYTRQGVGAGGELNMTNAEAARGSLYGYRIKEGRVDDARWTVLGGHWQSLGGPYSVQGRLQLQSDPDFNNHYLRSSFFRVTPELRNAAALVRQTPTSTTRVAYERLDERNGAGSDFLRTREAFPRLEFGTAPLPLAFGAVQNVTAFAERAFVRTNGFTHQSAGAAWGASRSFVLGRGFSFVPRLRASETFADKLVSTDTATGLQSVRSDAFVARYGAGGLVRWATGLGDWDLDYEYGVRSEYGGFGPERGADDRGIEVNRLALSDFWRPHRKAYVRVSTAYDLREFRTSSPAPARRFDVLRTEVSVTPRPLWSLTAIDAYDMDAGNQSILLQSDWGYLDGDRIGLGLFNSKARSGRTLVSHTASYGRGTWRLTGALRYELDDDDWTVSPYEKLVGLDKTFHDFVTYWEFRERSGVLAFNFNVHLRFTYERKVAETSLEAEREWYPWRRKPDDR